MGHARCNNGPSKYLPMSRLFVFDQIRLFIVQYEYLPSTGTVRYIPDIVLPPLIYIGSYSNITLLTVHRRYGILPPVNQDTLGDFNEYRKKLLNLDSSTVLKHIGEKSGRAACRKSHMRKSVQGIIIYHLPNTIIIQLSIS